MSGIDYDPYAEMAHRGPTQRETLLDEKGLPPSPRQFASKRSFYPFSLSLIAFWVVLIIGELVLLERSAAVAPTRVKLPWYYSNDGLPSALFTIFAQSHAPITALHLGRLSISALQSPRSAPRTWLEMFWMADRKWAGPVGILMTIWSVMKLRLRVSPILVLFSITTLVALVTPLVLNRAYPITALDVALNVAFAPNTLTPSTLAGIDAHTQVAVGGGSWATNLTVLDLLNSSTFTPIGNPARDDSASGDYFFAGDVQNMDVTVPGVRIQGECAALNNETTITSDSFTQQCQQQSLLGPQPYVIAGNAIDLNISFCTTNQFVQVAPGTNYSLLIWFQNNNQTGMLRGEVVAGVVSCNTRFTTGTASVFGRSLTYDNFVENSTLYSPTQGGEALLDPLYATAQLLTDFADASEDIQAEAFGTLGYGVIGDEDGLFYVSPSLDGFAHSMWRGATHMTVAMAVLSRTSQTTFAAVTHVPVSGRMRDTPFLAGALVLLIVWFLIMVGTTAALWRSTASGDSLNSYAAARLSTERLDLLNEGDRGCLEDNKRLLARFAPVNDSLN